MIKINLVPERQRIRSSPVNRILVALAMIIVIVCVVIYINQLFNEMSKKNMLSNTEAIYGILSQSKEKINTLNKYKNYKDAKSAQLIKLTEQRVPWCMLLSELSLVVPQQVKVQSLNGGGQIVQAVATDKKAPGKTDDKKDPPGKNEAPKAAVVSDNLTHIVLNCEAESYAVVAQFIDILNTSKRFSKPLVTGLASESGAQTNNAAVKFTVDVTANFK